MAWAASRLGRHISAGAAAAGAYVSAWSREIPCRSEGQSSRPSSVDAESYGMVNTEEGDFYGLFPKRQLWQPKPGLPYPLWDNNWDGRMPQSTGEREEDHRRMRRLRKEGVTRHIILIRHGQYDEGPKEDSERLLTPLGRKQADYTGRRLREMLEGDLTNPEFGPCRIRVVRVSNMARAKETADIIASHLPGVERANPDPDLNEGRPAHNIPGGRPSTATIEKTDEQHPRIEAAFQRYFYRADEPSSMSDAADKNTEEPVKHEFEIIVCHANVIRYFLCRALQLPPEAWLRLCTFNCSLTYLTIRPTGSVSCRMLGDIGHLPYGMNTFSGHPGFNW